MIIDLCTPGFNVASELQAKETKNLNGFHVPVPKTLFTLPASIANLLLSKLECKAEQVSDSRGQFTGVGRRAAVEWGAG